MRQGKSTIEQGVNCIAALMTLIAVEREAYLIIQVTSLHQWPKALSSSFLWHLGGDLNELRSSLWVNVQQVGYHVSCP